MQATLPVNVDCEEPAIITARDGEQILVLRHFQGKQVVHIYSIHVIVRDIQNHSQGASQYQSMVAKQCVLTWCVSLSNVNNQQNVSVVSPLCPLSLSGTF